MNFSDDWKNLLPISSVHSPPLLLSGSSAKTFGPLVFTPSTQTLTPLFSSPSLSLSIPTPPEFSLRKSLQTLTRPSKKPFIPPSLISSIVSNELSSQSDETDPISNNTLSMLRCPGNDFLIFFPTGENSDQVGFVKLSMKGIEPEIKVDKGGEVFTSEVGFNFRILKILVTSVAAASSCLPSVSGHSITVGFLLACTLYTVYWFRVDIDNVGLNFEKPNLVHLGMRKFHSSVIHACWSPHLLEESIVLLENGELFLFDLSICVEAIKLPMKLKGTRVNVLWDKYDFGVDLDMSDLEKVGWLSCEFSWHPRILIVACSSAVFLVDWRFEKSNVSILATIQVFAMSHSLFPDQFLAFCKAGSDGFYFALATKYKLFLIDIRKPLMPVLQWVHGLDKPHYINVLRLSELRSTSKEDNYRWATESGFAILLGSLWNFEFSIFCYGPSLPTPCTSVASKVSNLSNSLYAWELPSELSLTGRNCSCGDCYLREDFLKETLPEWIDWRQKKEIVLGFCILPEDLMDLQVEPDATGGFRLVRLVSSGKLESQIYRASWDFVCPVSKKSVNHTLSMFEESLLYLSGDGNYKFPRRFRYLNLDYLLAYLKGDLSKVLISNKQRSYEGPSNKLSYTQHNREVLCDKLKAAGVDQIGTLPAVANVLDNINLPMSIYEITLCRTWTGLPLDLLEFTFSTYPELLKVLVDQKKVSLEFLDVPNLPQLPPFVLRRPSSRSNKWSHKVQPGDALVGPTLPLSVLLTLCEVNKKDKCSVPEEEANEFSAETEIIHQCDTVRRVVSGMDLPKSSSEFHGSYAVSLADDGDEKWIGLQEPKSMFIYKPSAFLNGNNPTVGSLQEKPVPGDERLDTCISALHEKKFASNPKKELGGLEMFDELCPIELKSNIPPMDFVPTELKEYKLLKRQFLKFQEGFKQYQNFCSKSKIEIQTF